MMSFTTSETTLQALRRQIEQDYMQQCFYLEDSYWSQSLLSAIIMNLSLNLVYSEAFKYYTY